MNITTLLFIMTRNYYTFFNHLILFVLKRSTGFRGLLPNSDYRIVSNKTIKTKKNEKYYNCFIYFRDFLNFEETEFLFLLYGTETETKNFAHYNDIKLIVKLDYKYKF